MSTSHNKSTRILAIPTHKTIDWSSLKVGVLYTFRKGVDFEDFTVMRNRAHNAAKRLGIKALTERDSLRGVLKVKLYSQKQESKSRKRAK